MNRPRPARRWLLAAALALALVAAPQGAAAQPADPTSDPATPTGYPAGPAQVTLLTGDRVSLTEVPGGGWAATVEPAPRTGPPASFQTITHGEDVYVLPSDVLELVPQVLDRELFNVTKLAAAGHTDGIRVITTYREQPALLGLAAAEPAGLSVTAQLSSIDAVAGTIAPDGSWWQAVQEPAGDPSAAATGLAGPLSGVAKVWLDELVEAALDESAALVGAPEAWQRGLDGAGLTVAVLDTGIDADHPDLLGKVIAAENFSELSDTVDDRHGHGTHVAGIVAGSGAASGSDYVGVAPGASLMNGKVLGDGGSGFAADIIAGMEWAAASGADVINMSLGGAGTDGTDPMSQAVDALTEAHDVLFVIAAGNGGFGDHTIDTPGAASRALTVGSVDKQEQRAPNSGRGPRVGDFAIKPDLTAPGVGIIAARADGTALGPIVDEHYIQISGTSMAAPHAAAAAAILRQHDPELTAGELKAALATTAVPHPELDVYHQGGGRLDIPSVLDAPVLASTAPLDLGYLAYPQDGAEPVSAELSYTNRTDDSVELSLTLSVTSRDGAVPGDGLVVEPADLSLPPGGSGDVTVTLDPAAVANGLYGGYLVAEQAGTPVSRVPVGFYHEPESYDLAVAGTARDGRPAAGISSVDVIDVMDIRNYAETTVPYVDGVATFRVPAGTYSVQSVIYTYDGPIQFTQEQVFVAALEVEVTQDTVVDLDAREAVRIEVETPAHDAAPVGTQTISAYRADAGGRSTTHSYTGLPQPQFAVPTDPVTIGEFEYYSRWQLESPPLALSVTDPVAQELNPQLMVGSPALDEDTLRPLVYAGLGAPEDYAGLDVEGAVVLTRRGGPNHAEKEAAARAAGAAALAVANNVSGNYLGGVGNDAQIPAMTLSMEEGDQLLELLAGGAVTVRLLGHPSSDFRYDLVLPEPDQISAELSYVVEPESLVALQKRYHSDVPGHDRNEVQHLWRPYSSFSFGFADPVSVPRIRTDYLVPGDTRYQYQLYAEPPFTGLLSEPVTFYQPGERDESWWGQVTRPGMYPDTPVTRTGDMLSLQLAEWADSHPGHFGDADPQVDTTGFRFFQDGELVAEAPRPRGDYPMSADPAEYRLELDVARQADWWQTSTQTRTEWTIQSQRPGDGQTVALPLLLVDYQVGLDLLNTALPGEQVLQLTASHQSGANGAAIEELSLSVSYDDGANWLPVAGEELAAGQAEFALPPVPDGGSGYVSLRVEAADAAGNRIAQEIDRAWRLSAHQCDELVSGVHQGPLTVDDGVTCLAEGASVSGPVTVRAGAGLVGTGATISGPVSLTRAQAVVLADSTIAGPVSASGTTGQVLISGNQLSGPVSVTGSQTGDTPVVISGNTVAGPLSCSGNDPAPTNDGVPNQVSGPRSGQCADL